MTGESVTAAVEALLDDLELDNEGRARASIALALACKLDQAASSTSGAVAVAVPGTARELSATLDALLASQGETTDFVAELFGTPGA
ncbi:MAG: hypothetical protein ABSC90_08545 [Acidimicrobiales bacterium]